MKILRRLKAYKKAAILLDLEAVFSHLRWIYQPTSSKNEEVTWDRRGRARYVLENSSYATIYHLSTGGVYDAPSVADWHSLLRQQEPIMEIYCDRTLLWRAYINPHFNGEWD